MDAQLCPASSCYFEGKNLKCFKTNGGIWCLPASWVICWQRVFRFPLNAFVSIHHWAQQSATYEGGYSSSWKKSKMKEWNENSRMWGPYELCVTEVSSSGKVCSWPKDRPPRTKCAATRISETAPANYITELQKFCQHLPDQMELSFSYCVCVTRNMENGIFQISSTASQLGPVGTSDINWESLLTG